MTELTNKMVQGRLETVASGTYQPEIPGLPALVFVKMGLKHRGISSRAYSSKLKELYTAGGWFSEALIPTALEKICKENGLDIGVLKKQREILKRFYDSLPDDLSRPYDELTPEEVGLLSPEEQAERQAGIQEHGRRIMDWQQNFFAEDDYRILEQVRQIEQLEQHLKYNTAEHRAREYQIQTEILECARQMENIKERYFSSIEDIAGLEDYNRDGLVQLYLKWKQFKEGLLPQFFRPDNPS